MSTLDRLFDRDERVRTGSHRFEADAIIAFARRFDPQRFHVDAEAARHSDFGGLCASGWHTTAVWMRKNVDHRQRQFAAWRAAGEALPEFGPSPGFRNLRWMKPVYAGEEVVFFQTMTGSRPLESRPGWHLLEMVGEADSAEGKPVLRFESAVMIRIRS